MLARMDLPAPADDATLRRILAPVDPAAFVGDHLGRAPLRIKGNAGRFADLIGWDDLSRLLETHQLAPPRIRLFRASREIPGDEYQMRRGDLSRIDSGKLSALLGAGATLVLSDADAMLPRLATLADDLGAALRCAANVNIYAAWRKTNGFGAHWDSHDTFILQIAGRKHWRIDPPTRSEPRRGDPPRVPPPDGPPAWDGVIEDGDALYIPRGWPHIVTPLDEPSLHLTAGLFAPTGYDVLKWLAERGRDDPALRADLPRMADAAALAIWFDSLRDRIPAMLGEDAPDRFLAHWWAARPARPTLRFPDLATLPPEGLDDSTSVRLAAQRRLDINLTKALDQATFRAGGREWTCSRAVGIALAQLASDRAVAVGALAQPLSGQALTELKRHLTALALAGVILID